MAQYLVGCDVGTGGTKAVLMDVDGTVLGTHFIVNAGSCIITAIQAATAIYNSASTSTILLCKHYTPRKLI